MDSKQWDEEIIHDLFNVRDQSCIRNVNLDEVDIVDYLYYSKETTCHYSVHSAYRMLQAKKIYGEEKMTVVYGVNLESKSSSKSSMNLLWRALSRCFPNLSMMWNKFVPIFNVCYVCKEHNETIYHALVTCLLLSVLES